MAAGEAGHLSTAVRVDRQRDQSWSYGFYSLDLLKMVSPQPLSEQIKM